MSDEVIYFSKSQPLSNFENQGVVLLHIEASDAIWCQRTFLTLVQIMACCLMAPSHHLNQCWLILCRSFGIHLRGISQEMLKISVLDIGLEIIKITAASPQVNEFNVNFNFLSRTVNYCFCWLIFLAIFNIWCCYFWLKNFNEMSKNI